MDGFKDKIAEVEDPAASFGDNRVEALISHIRQEYGFYKRDALSSAHHAINVGKALLELKALTPHGQFQACVGERFEFSMRSARLYMQVAKSGLNAATVAAYGLNAAAAALDADTRQPPDDEEEQPEAEPEAEAEVEAEVEATATPAPAAPEPEQDSRPAATRVRIAPGDEVHDTDNAPLETQSEPDEEDDQDLTKHDWETLRNAVSCIETCLSQLEARIQQIRESAKRDDVKYPEFLMVQDIQRTLCPLVKRCESASG